MTSQVGLEDPSDYGSKVRFPQSIGMNVLEMLSRGIPSLISQEGFESWPELRDSSLIYVVNWRESEHVDQSILSALKTSYAERKSEAMRLRGVISIENHCKDLIERKRKIF